MSGFFWFVLGFFTGCALNSFVVVWFLRNMHGDEQ